jgi:hypothetical protein
VQARNANTKTGGDALWWAIVTVTTVGYGDPYPVTALGRTIGAIVMFAGVGIIGALAGVLSSFLIPTPETAPDSQREPAPALVGANAPLSEIKQELVAVRRGARRGAPGTRSAGARLTTRAWTPVVWQRSRVPMSPRVSGDVRQDGSRPTPGAAHCALAAESNASRGF